MQTEIKNICCAIYVRIAGGEEPEPDSRDKLKIWYRYGAVYHPSGELPELKICAGAHAQKGSIKPSVHMEEMNKARTASAPASGPNGPVLHRGGDDKAGLSEYIKTYKTELPPDIREIYCRSQAVSPDLYYASQVRRHKTALEAQVQPT